MDSLTLQSTPESGSRAWYDCAKRRKSSKVQLALATLANEQDRKQVADTLVGLHLVAFVCLILNKAVLMIGQGS